MAYSFSHDRSIRTSRTGRETMVYESYSWWTVYHYRDLECYIQVHDSYDSYGSWNNGLRVVQGPVVRKPINLIQD